MKEMQLLFYYYYLQSNARTHSRIIALTIREWPHSLKFLTDPIALELDNEGAKLVQKTSEQMRSPLSGFQGEPSLFWRDTNANHCLQLSGYLFALEKR